MSKTKDDVRTIPCDCEYWEEPCSYCRIDPVILVNGKPMIKSEYENQKKGFVK